MKLALIAPHSLRRRLLWFLLAAISLTALAQALIVYATARSEADEVFDDHMQQMAMSLRPGLRANGSENYHDDEQYDFVVQVWTADGLRVFQSTLRGELPQREAPGFSNIKVHGTTYRVFSMRSGNQVIQVAQDLAARHGMARTLALRTVGPMAVMVPLLMFLVWWVVTGSLAPVARVRSQVGQRQADDLTALSEAGLPDEIRPLVHELNLLFGRVEQAFDAQKSFVADAAHELRSPLAALRLQVQGLGRAGDEETRALAVKRLIAGIDRATRLVEQLLVLARQQAKIAAGGRPEPVSLAQIARSTLVDAVESAQARSIELGLGSSDDGEIPGHADALQVLMRNLLDNAIKYTPSGGRVELDIERRGEQLVLSVADSGPGIPEEDRQRVLDRFYRVPGTETTGSGLGLAIVKSIAEFHGATMTLGQSEELGGLLVEVRFPPT